MQSSINTPEEIRQMEANLINVMGMFKHPMTEFEVKIWAGLMDNTPKDAFDNFLKSYIISPQARFGAPKPNDAAAALGLATDPEAAYNTLEACVREYGPYQVPPALDPVLAQAIHNLGGWARVNELMPSAENTFEVRAFRERLNGAINQAVNQIRIQKQPAPTLVPIGGPQTASISLEYSSRNAIAANRDRIS
jgi:hypothetical protein